MKFEECRPFVRYARFLPLDQQSNYPPSVCRDARLFFCYSGKGFIHSLGTNYLMEEGNVLFLPAGTAYRLTTPKRDIVYLALNFDMTWEHAERSQPIPPVSCTESTRLDVLSTAPFSDAPALNSVLYLTQADSLRGILLRIEKEYAEGRLFYQFRMSALLTEALISSLRRATVEKEHAKNESARLIISYVQENYALPLTNRSVGLHFGLHENYVSQLVKLATGIPLHRYVIRIRIAHAVELLESGTLTVGQIAEKCGFKDIYHFSSCFKKIMGDSPVCYKGKST